MFAGIVPVPIQEPLLRDNVSRRILAAAGRRSTKAEPAVTSVAWTTTVKLLPGESDSGMTSMPVMAGVLCATHGTAPSNKTSNVRRENIEILIILPFVN